MSNVPDPGPLERQRLALTDEARATFLEALGKAYSVTHAVKLIGLSRQALYDARKGDEEFAGAWADAVETGTQVLEDELRRRALEGWTEDTHDGDGKLMRRVQRMSPQDLHTMLKARRPEVYRDNAQMTQVAVGIGGIDPAAIAEGVQRFEKQMANLRRNAEAPVGTTRGVLELADKLCGPGGAERIAEAVRRRGEQLIGGPIDTVDGEALEIEAGGTPAVNDDERLDDE